MEAEGEIAATGLELLCSAVAIVSREAEVMSPGTQVRIPLSTAPSPSQAQSRRPGPGTSNNAANERMAYPHGHEHGIGLPLGHLVQTSGNLQLVTPARHGFEPGWQTTEPVLATNPFSIKQLAKDKTSPAT